MMCCQQWQMWKQWAQSEVLAMKKLWHETISLRFRLRNDQREMDFGIGSVCNQFVVRNIQYYIGQRFSAQWLTSFIISRRMDSNATHWKSSEVENARMEGRSDDDSTYSHLLRRHKQDASSYSPFSVGRSSTVSRDGRSDNSFNSYNTYYEVCICEHLGMHCNRSEGCVTKADYPRPPSQLQQNKPLWYHQLRWRAPEAKAGSEECIQRRKWMTRLQYEWKQECHN